MKLDVWPVVTREAIVSAYRRLPTADSEAPFRTLRKHELVTAGKRLETREGRRLKGSVTMFSSLNVDAARLARHGLREQAAAVARLAAEVEASPEWWLLLRVVADGMSTVDRPASDPAEVLHYSGGLSAMSKLGPPAPRPLRSRREQLVGAVFDGSHMPDTVAFVMRGIARRTQAARGQVADQLSAVGSATVGAVSSLSEQVAVLRTSDGSEYAIPRAMAHSAHCDRVGALMALVSERVSDTASVFEVTPAFDLEMKVGVSAETLVRAMAKVNSHGWPVEPRPKYWPEAWKDFSSSGWTLWLSSPTWPDPPAEIAFGGPPAAEGVQLAEAGGSDRVVADVEAAGEEAGDAVPSSSYSPFGRHDPRTVGLTRQDAEILARRPAGGREHYRGPRLLVPVRIEG